MDLSELIRIDIIQVDKSMPALEGVNYSNWDGAIKQWGKIITGIEH